MERQIRLWEKYWVLKDFYTHKIKKNQLNSGRGFLLQYHFIKEEFLTFISGIGIVVINDRFTSYKAGENYNYS